LQDKRLRGRSSILSALRATSRRSPGPLLDRIDLQVEVPPLAPEEIASTTNGEPSADIRTCVEAARNLQRERFRRSTTRSNAEMTSRQLRRFCELDAPLPPRRRP
jgi:magnesium chelatase family protein